MAVSGSVNFSLTASDIVEEAFAMLGIFADEEPMQSVDKNRGIRILNMMLKGWQADGVKYWDMTEGSLALVQSQASYSFATGGDFATVPFDLMQVRITRSGTDLEMLEISREDYFRLPNKTSEGYPTQWFYDRQRDSGTLYVWPVPDATAGTLKFTYRRVINDMDSNPDNMDLPQEWYEAVVSNLADRLAIYYSGIVSAGTRQDVSILAARSYALAKSFNVGEGEGSFSILPERMGWHS